MTPAAPRLSGAPRPTAPRPTAARRDLLLVALLAAALFLPGLGARDLWNPDEARYAVVARNMFDGGGWLVPRINGEVYAEKPPLLFWSIAALSLPLGGVTETTARLPSALAAIGSTVLVFLLGLRLFGRRAAWLGAAAFATCSKILWQARFGQIDMLLTALVALGVWCWVRGETEDRPRLHALFFLFAGLATLAKGPVGLLPPLLSILAFLALTRDRRGLRRLRAGRGLLLWAAVVLAWLLPAALAGGTEYLEALVVRQTVTRYADPWHHQQPWYYYLAVLPGDFFPWSLLLPTAAVVAWRRIAGGWRPWRRPADATRPAAAGGAEPDRPAPASRAAGAAGAEAGRAGEAARARRGLLFALCWVAVTVLFFSLSSGKRTVYVLTMYPALALLVGAGLDRLAAAWEAREPGPSRAWLLVPLGLLAAPLLAAAAALPPVGLRRPELAILGEPFLWVLEAALLALLAAVLAAIAFARRRLPVPAAAALAAGMAALSLAAGLYLLPGFDAFKSARPLSAELLRRAAPNEPYGIYPHLDSTFLYYTGRNAVPLTSEPAIDAFLAQPGRQWLLARRDDLAEFEKAPRAVEIARDQDRVEGYVLLVDR